MKKFFLVIFSLVSLSSVATRAGEGGNEGGHGGDPYALEFVSIAKIISQNLPSAEKANPSLFRRWGLTSQKFREAIRVTRVVSKTKLFLRGQEVDAINNMSVIFVSRARWREASILQRVRLVFHEYLGIIGTERDHYDASVEFAPLLRAITKSVEGSKAVESNLFYGNISFIPALGQIKICSPTSAAYKEALAAARIQSKNRCLMSGKAECQLVSESAEEIISTETVGLRYCDITVISR